MPSKAYLDAHGVSSHMLRDYDRSPLFYYRKYIAKAIPDRDSDAFAFGRALHCRVLEGVAEFVQRFVIAPDEHLTESGMLSTKKATKEWLATLGDKTVISALDAAKVELLAKRVAANRRAVELLSVGQPEVEWRGTHWTGIPIKACVDWLSPTAVPDLKSCKSLEAFADDAREYGYDRQMAFYRAAFDRTDAPLIIVETSEPFRIAIARFSERTLAAAHDANEAALVRMARSYELDEWPGDPAEVIELDFVA